VRDRRRDQVNVKPRVRPFLQRLEAADHDRDDAEQLRDASPAEPMAKAFAWVALRIVATPWSYALDLLIREARHTELPQQHADFEPSIPRLLSAPFEATLGRR
jgi:hypothetical protein